MTPTGRAWPEACTVSCPDCHAPYVWPSGSIVLARHAQGTEHIGAGQAVTCPQCGTTYRLPAMVSRVLH